MIHVISIERGAIPTNASIGAPNTIANALPVSRLFAAGVRKAGSISRRSMTPELIVPVIMPYMDTNASSA